MTRCHLYRTGGLDVVSQPTNGVIVFRSSVFHIWSLPGLVNVYITNWKITIFKFGKSSISMGHFPCQFTRPGTLFWPNLGSQSSFFELDHLQYHLQTCPPGPTLLHRLQGRQNAADLSQVFHCLTVLIVENRLMGDKNPRFRGDLPWDFMGIFFMVYIYI